jgi:hypothetical protein
MLLPKTIARSAASTGPTINFSGTWMNELGSTMELIQAGASLTGFYRSAVSGAGDAVVGELAGWADGDLVAFSVNWERTASLTAWTGQLVGVGAAQRLKTMWLLVQNVDDPAEPSGLWNSTLVGADSFRRI